MTRIIAVIVSFFLFFGSVGSAPRGYSIDENADFSAVILSDMHMESNNPSRFKMIGSTLNGVFAGGNSPDVIAFTGDNTMNSQMIEWFLFYGFLNRFCKNSDVIAAMGNHDFGNSDSSSDYDRLSDRAIESYNYYCRKSIDNVYYSSDYGCVKIIALSSEQNVPDTVSVITDGEIDWLKGELDECRETGKLAVVLNHNLIRGRNGERSYYSFNMTTNNDKLDAALTESGADVIYVCGHSHFGLNDGTFSRDGKVSYVNLPSAGNERNYDAEGKYGEYGIGMLLEVYGDEAVISFHNFAKGTDFEDFVFTVER